MGSTHPVPILELTPDQRAGVKHAMRKLDRKRRRRLMLLCPAVCVTVAEAALIGWSFGAFGIQGINMIAIGVVPAALIGAALGVVSMLWIPFVLGAKAPDAAATRVMALASAAIGIAGVTTGYFPVIPAGLALSAVTVVVALTMPNERFAWSGSRCPGCGYDLSKTPDACPECGVRRDALEAWVAHRPRMSAAGWIWMIVVIGLWIGALVLAIQMEPE